MKLKIEKNTKQKYAKIEKKGKNSIQKDNRSKKYV